MSRPARPGGAGRRAFTLVEVLLALGLAGLVVAGLWAFLLSARQSEARLVREADQLAAVSRVLRALRADLRAARVPARLRPDTALFQVAEDQRQITMFVAGAVPDLTANGANAGPARVVTWRGVTGEDGELGVEREDQGLGQVSRFEGLALRDLRFGLLQVEAELLVYAELLVAPPAGAPGGRDLPVRLLEQLLPPSPLPPVGLGAYPTGVLGNPPEAAP